MRAVRIAGYGEGPVLQDVPVPEVGTGEVLVRVAAASLNPLDVKLARGDLAGMFPIPFPHILGTDLAGTIERTGPGVHGWKGGDRVVARLDPTAEGALAELAAVPAAALVAVPASLPLELAAGIPTAGGTAWQALFETADLRSGQRVLVHAGAGGVGSFAVQLARAAGASVAATASGPGVDIARRLGAEQVVDHRLDDFVTQLRPVDVVLDTVGGDTLRRSLDLLGAGGTLVTLPQPPDPAVAEGRDATVTFIAHASDAGRLQCVVERVAGGVEVLVDCVVPLTLFGEAFAHQAGGHAHGKVVLTTSRTGDDR